MGKVAKPFCNYFSTEFGHIFADLRIGLPVTSLNIISFPLLPPQLSIVPHCKKTTCGISLTYTVIFIALQATKMQ